ncbi:MAG: AAA family ATPase, partial [Candidatus Heimdallarchaeota archaeon]|nr:AAA family ATPase [Candidatus Heimdallarchaeota archaeon]
MGSFNKSILSQFIENECDRQLFIQMGRDDPNWLSPVREIAPLDSIRRGPKSLVTDFGVKYEQHIYMMLRNVPKTSYHLGPKNDVAHKLFDFDELQEIYKEIIVDKEDRLFLERGFNIPDSFFRQLFGVGIDADIPLLNHKSKPIYPDVLILDPIATGFELNLDGTVSEITDGKLRIGINIVDIKKSSEENIGKKQFIEIIYYGIALRHYLRQHNLDSMYFIKVDGNGIFPGFDYVNISTINNFKEKVVPVVWRDIFRLFSIAISKIQKLWGLTPTSIESTETNIRTMCGRCDFYDDCHISEGGMGDPNDMSVKLLPYTSMSTAQQLNTYGIKTVGDLVNKIDGISIGNVPKPIYAELPLLRLKAAAITKNVNLQAQAGELLSVSIPKYNDISIYVNLEEDPLHGRVFGASISMDLAVFPTSPFYKKFEDWWYLWRDFLEGGLDIVEFADELIVAIETHVKISEVKEINRILKSLRQYGAILRLKGSSYTNKDGEVKSAKFTTYNLTYSTVNENLSDKSEFELTKMILIIIHNIIRLSSIIEKLVVQETKIEEKTYTNRPSTAIYYWSQDIMETFENLLQRQISQIMLEPELNNVISFLISWFTPSESMVKDSNQFRKIFDLRKFVETTQGLPYTINYTWHGIYSDMTKIQVHKNYFSPHFNYMDHNVWYAFLMREESSAAILEGKLKSKSDLREGIKKQLNVKIRAIRTLKQEFQKKGRELISRSSTRPIESESLILPKVSPNYHDVARIWYLYSRLMGAYSEQDADNFRYMYPQYSIGKLAAAEVSILKLTSEEGSRGGKKYTYNFELQGLSSNMKLKVGDRVLLLPEELRDFVGYRRNWEITIKTIDWDNTNDSVQVTTEFMYKNLFLEYESIFEKKISDTTWYLFPTGGEFWTSKLSKIFQEFNLGNSWLGKQLSYKWGITPELKDDPPSQVNLQEVYMYMPKLLDKILLRSEKSLLTKVKYPPNRSQEIAILNSMSSVISSIQGPPGTGKSQTIVALIDEFIRRSKKKVNILVTSFSYQALNVLVDKIDESINSDGTLSEAAKLPRIYLRSGAKSPHSKAIDLIKSTSWKLDGVSGIARKENSLETYYPDGMILFGVAHQIFNLRGKKKNGEYYCLTEDFSFDLIIVDEASQMPVDQLLASLLFIRRMPVRLINLPKGENIKILGELEKIGAVVDGEVNELTKVVLVGDFNQLPPVQTIPPPLKLNQILGSLFSYFIEHHKIPNKQLEINYRSHEIIVQFTERLGFYTNLAANITNANSLLPGNISLLQVDWVREVMDPTKVVATLIHDHDFETAISMIEAQITVDLILAFYKMSAPQSKEEEKKFFLEQIGVVAPHNAHGRLIIRLIYEKMNTVMTPHLDDSDLMEALQKTIFSVEKFQGSDRNFIIGSIGISSKDQLMAEEEFIY